MINLFQSVINWVSTTLKPNIDVRNLTINKSIDNGSKSLQSNQIEKSRLELKKEESNKEDIKEEDFYIIPDTRESDYLIYNILNKKILYIDDCFKDLESLKEINKPEGLYIDLPFWESIKWPYIMYEPRIFVLKVKIIIKCQKSIGSYWYIIYYKMPFTNKYKKVFYQSINNYLMGNYEDLNEYFRYKPLTSV